MRDRKKLIIAFSLMASFGGMTQHAQEPKAPIERPLVAQTFTSLVSHDKHVLKNGDVITYLIRQDPFASKVGPLKLPISDLGVQFPITHDPSKLSLRLPLGVTNKSIGQIKEELRSLLTKDYYHQVELEIFLESKAEQIGKVQIFDIKGNQINTSLKIDLTEPPTLTEALAQVKFKDSQWLDYDRVVLIRKNPKGEGLINSEIKWKDALTGKAKDPELKDGDRIQVREKGLKF